METGTSSTGNGSSGSSIVRCATISLSGSGASIAVALCYGILIPLIVVGNGLVVIAFIINHKLRTATNIFICGLGLSDLLIGLFSVPYWTYISALDSLMDAYCTPSLYRAYICIDIWTGCASILQLTSIAIERLYFTIAPLRHRRLPRSVYWYMLGIAWFYSTLVAGLQPLQSQAHWEEEYSVFLLVTCFVFPLFIIIAVYLYILKTVRRQAKKTTSTRTRMGSTGGDFKEFHIFITVIVITGVFIIAWTPFFVVTVVASLCHGCISHPDPLVRFVKWMQYSSSAINPYIYAYRNNEVKSTFKKVVRSCFCGFGARNKFDKPPKNARNVRQFSIEQGTKKPEDDSVGNSCNGGTMNPQNRHARQDYPRRILNIDERIGHIPSSRTNAPRDSKHRGQNTTGQDMRSSNIRVNPSKKKTVNFYENNGFVGIQTSAKCNEEMSKDITRKRKEIDNRIHRDSGPDLSSERQRNTKYSDSHRNKKHPNLSGKTRPTRESTNHRLHRSRDEYKTSESDNHRFQRSRDKDKTNESTNHRFPTSRDENKTHESTNHRFPRSREEDKTHESTNHIRVHRSRDENKTAHESTNQKVVSRPRAEDTIKYAKVDHIRTNNDAEISDKVSYV